MSGDEHNGSDGSRLGQQAVCCQRQLMTAAVPVGYLYTTVVLLQQATCFASGQMTESSRNDTDAGNTTSDSMLVDGNSTGGGENFTANSTYIPAPIDTDETASFIYAGAGVGGLMVISLLLIIIRSFYVHKGSYDLKREREIAERQPKPPSPASPTQFSAFPLSVYNETSPAQNGSHPNSRSYAEGPTSRPHHAMAVANVAALEQENNANGYEQGGGNARQPVAPTRPNRDAPTSPPRPSALGQTNNAADNSFDVSATMSSTSPLISSSDANISEKPTPKVRNSIRQKNSGSSSATREGDSGDVNRPAPRPRANTRSRGPGGSQRNSREVESDREVIFNSSVMSSEAASSVPSQFASGGDAVTRGSNDGSPQLNTAFERQRSQKRGSTRKLQAPVRPPSNPPPSPPSSRPHFVLDKPNRPAPPAPPPRGLSQETENEATPTVPFLHFDLTNVPSNASEMTYAADHRPDSFVIDL